MHPLESSIIPIVPAGTRELGLQKSPSNMFYTVPEQGCNGEGGENPAKFTPSPAAEQTGLGEALGSAEHPEKFRLQNGGLSPSLPPQGIFSDPPPESRTRREGGMDSGVCRDFPALQRG